MSHSKDALKNVQIAWSNSLKGRSPAIAEFFEPLRAEGRRTMSSSFAFEISGKGRQAAEVAKPNGSRTTPSGSTPGLACEALT